MAGDRTGEWSWRVFFRGVAKALGLRGGLPPPEMSIAALDPWNATPTPPEPEAIAALLDEIERDALAVYADHGLPTHPGHYARAPGDLEWQFVAERMGPEDRWALIMDYPPEQGWKFATLPDLGLRAGDNGVLHVAGRLLAGCTALRATLKGGRSVPAAETLEAAVRLGAEWRGLQVDTAWHEAEPVTIAKPKRLLRKKPQ